MNKETFIQIITEIREILLNQKNVLTIDELCRYTSYEKSYIYKLTSKRKIPHYKTPGGKSIFFKRIEIDEWLTQIKIKTTEQIKVESTEKVKKFQSKTH